MLAIAAPFFLLWLRDRRQWAFLIPAYVLAAVALVIPLSDAMPSEVLGTYVMWVVGLPFIVAFLLNREQWGLLIPGGV